MTETSAASSIIRLTSTNSDDAPPLLRRGMEKPKCIYRHFEAASYRLSSYSTDDVIAKAATKDKFTKKNNIQTAVRFAGVLKNKILKRGQPFFEQRNKYVFVKELPLNDRNNMEMY